MIKLDDLKPLEKNPRKITSKNKRVLKESIEEDIKFLEFKPLLVDEDNTILAGNQRYTILKELGYSEVPDEWIKKCIGLSDEEKKRLIVKDNVSLGQFTTNIYEFIDKDKIYDFNIKIKKNWNEFTNKIEDVDYDMEVTYPIYINCDEELFEQWKSVKKQHKMNDTEMLEFLIENYENK